MTAKIVQFATVQGPHGPALVLLREDGQLSGQVSAGPLDQAECRKCGLIRVAGE